jgi:hypothetical protein
VSTLAVAPLWATEVGGEPTLEALLEQAWAALGGGAAAVCPVCEATMEPEYGQHAMAIAGRCTGCGAQLS